LSAFTRLNDDIEHRSRDFTKFGVKPIDALHLAAAEALKADYFCTCDDNFLKKAQTIGNLGVKAVSILELLQELENGNCGSNVE
jgi:predicted nucleic acid-binding protein